MKTIYKDLSSYDSLLAYKLSVLCKNIYYNKDTFLNGLKNFGFTSCEYIEKKNIELFLGYRDNFIIIVFRGTDSVKDWLTNIKITGMKEHQFLGKVHRGFLSGFELVKEDIDKFVSKYYKETDHIICTGHSLGGALSALCAVEYYISTSKKVYNYTYGCPRFCDRKFAEKYNKMFFGRSFRHVNQNDVVCQIPAPIKYRHVGQEIYFDEEGIRYFDSGLWQKIYNFFLGSFTDFFSLGFDCVKDHSMSYYFANLLYYINRTNEE